MRGEGEIISVFFFLKEEENEIKIFFFIKNNNFLIFFKGDQSIMPNNQSMHIQHKPEFGTSQKIPDYWKFPPRKGFSRESPLRLFPVEYSLKYGLAGIFPQWTVVLNVTNLPQ